MSVKKPQASGLEKFLPNEEEQAKVLYPNMIGFCRKYIWFLRIFFLPVT